MALKSFAPVTWNLDNDALEIVTLSVPLRAKKNVPLYPTIPTSTWMHCLFQSLTAWVWLWNSVGINHQFFPFLVYCCSVLSMV